MDLFRARGRKEKLLSTGGGAYEQKLVITRQVYNLFQYLWNKSLGFFPKDLKKVQKTYFISFFIHSLQCTLSPNTGKQHFVYLVYFLKASRTNLCFTYEKLKITTTLGIFGLLV